MKINISNRQNQKIVVVINQDPDDKGLAFVMHGLGGFKEQPHIEIMVQALREAGYAVVRFDATNSFGESEGNYEDATVTNYYHDLEDVIVWAGSQSFYWEPFILAGHSIGGLCTALYAEKHPEKVKALAPISTVVSGRLSMEAHKKHDPEGFAKYRETGWDIKPSTSKPGVIKKLKWSHVEDRLKYDLLPEVKKLTMPVLLIVGEKDYVVPVDNQQILFQALPGPKELHIIKSAPHTFKNSEHLAELRQIFDDWLTKYGKTNYN
jgi:pimeloyl-ACP methyl ester carboxylesterase